MPELLFDFLMRTAEKISDWRLKQHFIRKKCLKIWCLLEPLMPGDARAALGAENKSHISLREASAFSVCPDIVGESG